jgi:predicted homoserine dehydrogenase-like protein
MRRTDWSEALRADRAAAPQITVVGRIAAHMDKSESLVYKMFEGEHAPSITQLIDFAELTGGHNIMAWLGRMTRHHVVPVPAVEATPISALPDLCRDFGDMVEAVNDALADGQMTRDEAAHIRTAGEHLIAAVYAMTLAAERAAATTPIRPSTLAEATRRAK